MQLNLAETHAKYTCASNSMEYISEFQFTAILFLAVTGKIRLKVNIFLPLYMFLYSLNTIAEEGYSFILTALIQGNARLFSLGLINNRPCLSKCLVDLIFMSWGIDKEDVRLLCNCSHSHFCPFDSMLHM